MLLCLLVLLCSSITLTQSQPITIDIQAGGSQASTTTLSMDDAAATPSTMEQPPPSQIIHTTVDPTPTTVDFSTDLPLFVPTDEWQEVMPGQHVPGGLHYRLDLSLGKKWAKKLEGVLYEDEEEDLKKRVRIIDSNGGPGNHDSDSDSNASSESSSDRKRRKHKKNGGGLKRKKLTPEQEQVQRAELMDRVLRGLPAPPPELEGLSRKIDPEKWKEVLNTLWTKRQREIHSASAAIHNSATAMMNATRDLLDVTTTEAEKMQILTAMEREVRQIDNAQDYKTVGGLAVTASLLDDPSLDVRRMSAFVMASASRNHAVVQAAALDLGVVDALLKHLKTTFDANSFEQADFRQRLRTETKLLLALGAVVRGSKDGITHLSSIGGGDAISNLVVTCVKAMENQQNQQNQQKQVDVNGNAEADADADAAGERRRTTRELCGLRDKAFMLVTDLLDGQYPWTLSPVQKQTLITSSIQGDVFGCSSNPSREVVLRLLKSFSSGDDEKEKDDAQNSSINTMVQQWLEEWRNDVKEDSEDEYAAELVTLGVSVVE